MEERYLLSLVESTRHPDFSALYKQLSLKEHRVMSQRKAFSFLKKQAVNFVVAEFFYGYGNNYAGANVRNLDVLFSTLQKYSPESQVVILVTKKEQQYVKKLERLIADFSVLVFPMNEVEMQRILENKING